MAEDLHAYGVAFGVPVLRDASHKMLEELVKKYNPTEILEIGTAIGYSGITMLKNSNANLTTIELMEGSFLKAKENFEAEGFSGRVNAIHGDCNIVLTEMICDDNNLGKFDFVFLDGPKGQYIKMLDCLLLLLKSGGVLVADNVLFRGYVQGGVKYPRRFKTIVKRLGEFIETCKSHDELEFIELDESDDGMLIAKKR